MQTTLLYKVKLLFLSILFLAGGSRFLYAQTYIMTNGGSISTCSGTFLDPGGNSNYTNNLNCTYTIWSSNGTHINANFTMLKTQANLSVNSVLASVVNAQICSGNSYTLPNGSTVTAAGTYTTTLTSISGCDSVITTNLSVNSVLTSTVNAQICSGSNYVLPNGTSVSVAGTYTTTLTSASGCDSIITTNLSVNPVLTSTVNAQICSGNNYTLPNGTSVSAAGTYTTTLTSASGCDSIITTNLSVNPVLTSTVNAQICSGSNYVLPNGTSVSAAGTYTTTLTSASGCDSVITTNLIVNGITLSQIHTNPSCGLQNGNINLSESGGVAPYTFTWSNGATTEDLLNISSGNYSITVSDISGCSAALVTTLNNVGGAMNLGLTINNPTCAGLNNGSVIASASGSSAPYAYHWSNGSSMPFLFGLSGGNFSLTVTSASGCIIDTTIQITSVSPITIQDSIVPSVCTNSSAQLFVNVTGGTAPYHFLWSNGATSQNLINLPSTLYQLTVTDNHNCIGTISANIPVMMLLGLSETHNNSVCNTGSGNIDLTPSGGTMPYQYIWSNGETTEDVFNLNAGNYDVTVFDTNGCSSSLTIPIQQINGPVLNETHVNENCNLSNGSITTTISGGVAPFAYLWSNGNTTPNVSGLSAGIYSVTVTDGNSCHTQTGISIINSGNVYSSTVNAQICSGNSYTLPNGPSTSSAGQYITTLTSVSGCDSVITTNLSVNSVLTSTVNAQICSGSSYTLPNGASTSSAGQYTTTLTSASGCDSVITTNLSVNPVLTSTVNAQICSGNNYTLPNGATVNAAGTYATTLTSASGCDSVITTNLSVNPVLTSTVNAQICSGNNYTLPNGTSVSAAGTYTTTLTSITGCDSIITTNLSVNPVLTSTVNAQICSGSNYVLLNGTSVSAAGTYTTTLTSISGCDSVITTNLSVNSVLTSTVNAQICSGSNYVLPNGISVNAAGTYTTTLTSVSGCDSVITTNLSANPVLTSTVNAQICSGSNYVLPNGSSTSSAGQYITSLTSVSGCDSVITTNLSVNPVLTSVVNTQICSGSSYTLPNGASTSSAGQYITTLTSVSGCDSVITTNLSVNPVLTSTVNAQICSGNNYTLPNGTSVSAAGTYTTTLTSVSGCDSIIITNLSVNPVLTSTVNAQICSGSSYTLPNGTSVNATGTYTTTLTSLSGCDSIITTNLTIINLTATETHVNATCGNNNGSANISVNGGTTPYSFVWNSGGNAQSPVNMAAGNYTVTVSDANNCWTTKSLTITNTTPPVLSESHVLPNCGQSNGSIQLSVSGGTAPYTYLWNTGDTDDDLNSISTGNYSVTATDVNACSDTMSIVITCIAPTPCNISANAIATNTSCSNPNDGSVALSVSNANGAITYSWSNGSTLQNLTNLSSGNYFVTITDSNNCSVTANATVGNNLAASLTETHVNASCGNANGSINLSVNGGTAPYTYLWSNSSTTQDVSNLSSGNYFVTVTDSNNCNSILSVLVDNGIPPIATETHTNANCGFNNGTVTLSVSYGIPPYSYQWSNGSTTQNLSNLPVGNYDVTVTDAAGCTVLTDASISMIPAPLISSTFVQPICGASNGSIDITASGGTQPYANLWNTGATTEDLNSITDGVYSVTVTDANFCANSITVNLICISAPPCLLTVNAAPMNVSCFGANDGGAAVNVLNATGALTYQWSNGQTFPNLNGVGAGTYTLNVHDGIGCAVSTTVTVSQPNDINLTTIASDVNCYGNSSGSATATVSGGFAPYSYLWNNGATTFNIQNVISNTYSVTVTDNNGCNKSASIVVNQPPAFIVNANASNASCGLANGSIDLTAFGGSGNYSYVWNTGDTTEDINNLSAGIYSVTAADGNGCQIFSTSNILATAAPVIVLTSPTNVICAGNSIALSASGADTYSWSPSIGLNMTTGSNVISSTMNSATYTVTGTIASSGCSGQGTIVISVSPLPSVSINASSTNICANETAILTANGANNYLWSSMNGVAISTASMITVSPDTTTTYMLIGYNQLGCADTAYTTINSVAFADVVVDVLPAEGCDPLVVKFDNHTTGASIYSWSFGDGNSSNDISPIHTYHTGSYDVNLTVTSTSGCLDTIIGLANILVHPTPTANFTVNPGINQITTLDNAQFTFLNYSSNASNYQWNFGYGAVDTFKNVMHIYHEAGDYAVTLIAYNEFGCADTITQGPLNVVEDGSVFIPNTFTPNNDGKNDIFKIRGTGIDNYTMQIFDRWGELVFDGKDGYPQWDGTFKGQPVNIGVYAYVVEINFSDGTKTYKKGDVTIVR